VGVDNGLLSSCVTILLKAFTSNRLFLVFLQHKVGILAGYVAAARSSKIQEGEHQGHHLGFYSRS